MPVSPTLNDSWTLGGVAIANRVVLAPLAGIGNWFVRLQAKRYGAGLVVSEMVSSFAVHYRNERTCRELLRIHPDEHPMSVQLFGHDPDVMASAAERVAAAGADLIDINMGCPVPKVCKTGAGAALLSRSGSGGGARARGRAGKRAAGHGQAADGAAPRRPRAASKPLAGWRPTAASPGSRIHPRHASQRHSGAPDYELARITGGGAAGARDDLGRPADRGRGAAAPSSRRAPRACCSPADRSGNPWLFEQLLGRRAGEPDRDGDPGRARLGARAGVRAPRSGARRAVPAEVLSRGTPSGSAASKSLQAALQRAATVGDARDLFTDASCAAA